MEMKSEAYTFQKAWLCVVVGSKFCSGIVSPKAEVIVKEFITVLTTTKMCKKMCTIMHHIANAKKRNITKRKSTILPFFIVHFIFDTNVNPSYSTSQFAN